MMFQRVGGCIGGGQDFDVELLKERARAKFRFGKLFGDLVINGLRAFASEFFADPKDFLKGII